MSKLDPLGWDSEESNDPLGWDSESATTNTGSFNIDGKNATLGSVNGIPTLYTTDNPDFPLINDMQDKIPAWEKKGKIGWFEQWERFNNLKLIPVVSAKLQEAENKRIADMEDRIFEDKYDTETTYDPLTPDPTDPSGFGILFSGGHLFPKTEKIDFERAKQLRQKDLEDWKKYSEHEAETAVRGVSWGGMFAKGVQGTVPFIGEMAMTQGLDFGPAIAEKIAWGTGKLAMLSARALSSVIATPIRTTGMLGTVNAKAGEQEIAANLMITDKGQAILSKSEQQGGTAFLQAFGKQMIEVWTEDAGNWLLGPMNEKIGLGISKMLGPKATKFFTNTLEAWDASTLGTLLKKGSFNGPLSEMEEERLGDILNGVFGQELEDDKEKNIFKRIWNRLPNVEQLSVEAVMFSVPGLTSYVGGQIQNRLSRRGVSQPQINEVLGGLTALEQENYIARDNERIDAAFNAINFADELNEDSEAVINEKYNAMVEDGQIDPTLEVEDARDQHLEIQRAIARKEAMDGFIDTFATKDPIKSLEEELGIVVSVADMVEKPQETQPNATAINEQAQGAEAPLPMEQAEREDFEPIDKVYGDTVRMIQETFTPADAKLSAPMKKATNPFIGVMRRIFRAEALKQYGQVGKDIFNGILAADKDAYENSNEAIYQLVKRLRGMTQEQSQNFHKYVRNEMPTPENLVGAVAQWRAIARKIAIAADRVGIVVTLKDGTTRKLEPKDTYYPDFIKDAILERILSSGNSFNTLVDETAKSLKIDRIKAEGILLKLRKNKASTYGHLEKPKESELPDEYYERDPRVALIKYIRGASTRIAEAKQFGAKNEKLNKLYDRALSESNDYEEIRRLAQNLIGQDEQDNMMHSVSNFARSLQVVTKLGLGQLTNIADVTKAVIRTNGVSGLKGLFKAFTKEGWDFSSRVGVRKDEIERFAKEQGLSVDKISAWVYEYTGMEKSEEFVRTVAVNASRNYLTMLHKKLQKKPNSSFLQRRIEQFGLDPAELAKRPLTIRDYTKAASSILFDSQPISRTDSAYYWSGDGAKIIVQFKSFAHKQARFVNKFVIQEAWHGNFVPAFWMLVLSQVVGEPLANVKAFVRGKEREDVAKVLDSGDALKITKRVFENYLTIGGFGLVTDASAIIFGYGAVEGIATSILGPTISDIISYLFYDIPQDIITAFGEREFQKLFKLSKKGKVQSHVAKKLLYSIPTFGPALSNQAYPSTKSIGHTKKGKRF